MKFSKEEVLKILEGGKRRTRECSICNCEESYREIKG